MNRFIKSEKFFHIGMASRPVTALDQLNHIIDATFSSVDRQLEDGIIHILESSFYT